MRILDLFERVNRIDDWLNTSLLQKRHNFSCEGGGDFDLLLQRSRAQDRTDDMKTFAEDLIQIDTGPTARNSTYENDATLQRHRFEAGGEVWTTIQIKHDVKSAFSYRRGKLGEFC